MAKQKLELTWIGKENRPRLEPRILLEDPVKSYHAKFRRPPRPQAGEGSGERENLFGNRLIFSDNLLALKALEREFFGKVKCVFIDPPYNTVLDSFAGSGTTGAVAHKMGWRWIMIELGEHCHTVRSAISETASRKSDVRDRP